MSPYMKRFVLASLFYLGLAAAFGMFNSVFGLTYSSVFAHTHFSLLGFMAMIVFGIGYFILPRFNGTDLKFPGWVPVHFWLANISLIGMVVFRGLSVETGTDAYAALFILFASMQAVSLMMFVINVWLTLTLTGKLQPDVARKRSFAASDAPVTRSASPIAETVQSARGAIHPITADTRIADLVDAAPSIKELLVSAGLRSLAMPGHLDQVRAMGVTVGTAAGRHGLDLDSLLVGIEQELQRQAYDPATAAGASRAQPTKASETLSADVLVGSVMEKHPETRRVFQKYFGDGCFDCPGQAYESVGMACRMHGVDQQVFLRELNSSLMR